MGILLSCSYVSTTVWMHHMDFDETLGEKVRWKLHKDAICYFKQILEAAPDKTAGPVSWDCRIY